ncbi:hypothetical protein RGQ15_07065 [Paracoccus sp. MBLB3053]|uniref:Uncharacterized protein n=1 Tax=Paracoccus aurantius TaxID=3073814 RepID=A0ABU2HQL8_9RHOB|nr:hypothetical protein [Paracoccus sp. MBLB3053]MDS9467333.1 hypothetical protein [Paracoccus sp. MBLB3053]
MAERQRLSPHDHALIHALALLSRPELRDRSKIGMIVGMIQDVLPRVSRQVERLRPLIVLAEQFASQKQGPLGDFGGLHDRARSIMNDWDGRRLADAWDVVTGKAE